jgi:hypothetical protein
MGRKYLTTILVLCMGFSSCSGESATGSDCSAVPQMDGQLHSLEKSCRFGSEEHLQLTELTIPEGESLRLFIWGRKSDGSDAIEITLESDGVLTWENGASTFRTNLELFSAMDICMDFHVTEQPIQLIVWTGNCTGDLPDAVVNTADGGDTGSLIDLEEPRFFYQSSSAAVSLERIQTDDAIYRD